MEIKFKICSCQKNKFNSWKKFVETLKNILKKEIKLDFLKKIPEELEEKVDLFYVSFPFSLILYKKNYKPIAKFKNQKDEYLIIGNENLEKIKNKEKIKIFITNHPFSFYLLFCFISQLDLDFSKILVITINSYEKIVKKLLRNEGEFGIVSKKTVEAYLNKFLFIKESPFKVSHYFLVPSDSALFFEIKKALFSIDKELIKALGFKDIEILNEWEEEFIKNFHFLGKFFSKIIEDCTILESLSNSPYFGIGIYHETFLYANPYLCKLLGYTIDEFQRMKPEEILYYEEDKIFARKVIKKRLRGEFFILPYHETTFKTKDGKKVEVLLFTCTIFYQNKYCGMIVAIDITKQKILENFNKFLRKINRAIITCTYETEIYEKILPDIYETLNLKAVWIGIPDYKKDIIKPKFFYPKNLKFLKNWKTSISSQKCICIKSLLSQNIKIVSDIVKSDLPHKKKLLSLNIHSLCAIPLVKHDQIISILILCSEEPNFFNKYKEFLKELQKVLSFALNKIDLLFKNYIINEFIKKPDEILIICDEKGNIEYINPFGFELLSKLEENLLETNCFELLYLSKKVLKELREKKKDIRKVSIYSKPGKEKLILDLKISLLDLPGNIKKLIILGKDLTKEIEFEKEKHTLQYIDSLTGLLNYSGFSKRVSEILSFLKVRSLFIVIDFYNFSYINRFYGLDAGDFCLKELAKKLNVLIGKKGIVGRTSGDEFSLFLIDIKAEEVIKWLNKIKTLISLPLEYKNKIISLEFNAAVVFYPDDGKTFEELWQKVNILLSETKKKGANVIEIFNPLIETQVEKIFKIDTLVKKALKENLFVFYYQPFFETQTLKLAGVEALVRIREKAQLVLPGEFIKYLEESPYLIEFEFLNFKKNLEKLKKWKIPISINISSKSFRTLNFEEVFLYFKNILSEFSSYLILEITEHAFAKDIEKAKEILKTIKSFNIKIALDDFGVGYSSLNYLKDLPIDILKIDLSFIKSMVDDTKTYHIVTAIINLAHYLNIKTVAEGVETKTQLEILKKLKCDYVQGFLLSPPLPEEEIENLIKSKKIIL